MNPQNIHPDKEIAVTMGLQRRDQRLERVHMPYSFGVLPELVWRLTRGLLAP